MTQVKDVERLLFDWAPAELAADWDNVGLLVGDPDREVRKNSPHWTSRSLCWKRLFIWEPISLYRIIR